MQNLATTEEIDIGVLADKKSLFSDNTTIGVITADLVTDLTLGTGGRRKISLHFLS